MSPFWEALVLLLGAHLVRLVFSACTSTAEFTQYDQYCYDGRGDNGPMAATLVRFEPANDTGFEDLRGWWFPDQDYGLLTFADQCTTDGQDYSVPDLYHGTYLFKHESLDYWMFEMFDPLRSGCEKSTWETASQTECWMLRITNMTDGTCSVNWILEARDLTGTTSSSIATIGDSWDEAGIYQYWRTPDGTVVPLNYYCDNGPGSPSGASCNTLAPSTFPTSSPFRSPSTSPTQTTRSPSRTPTEPPTRAPSESPSRNPSRAPSRSPSRVPSSFPTRGPSRAPSKAPSQPPTSSPTSAPTTVALATYRLYYNHTGIDYLFVNLEEYRLVMSEAVTSAFKRTLSLKVTDSGSRRRLLQSLNTTLSPNQSALILDPDTIDQRIAAVSVCAVFTLDLTCADDRNENTFHDRYSRKQFGGAVYKAQGTVFYSGDDVTAAVGYSNELLNVLFLQPDESVLFEAIGEEMSNSSIGGSFIVGGMDIQTLSFGTETKAQDDFVIAAFGFGIVTYVLVGLCLIACLSAELHGYMVGIEVKSVAWVYIALYTWDFYSDLVFAVRLATLSLWALFVPALVFIVVPYLLNFHQLFNEQQEWVKDPEIKDRVGYWLLKHNSKLILLSMICGSTFGATELSNSGSFGHTLFSMGVTEHYLKQLHSKRLYSSVLFENVPQLVIQVLYLTIVENNIGSQYAIIAMCSSLASLLISAVESYHARALIAVLKSDVHTATLEVRLGRHRRDEINYFGNVLSKLIFRPKRFCKAVGQSISMSPKVIEVGAIYKTGDELCVRFTVFGMPKRTVFERFTESMANDSFQYSLKQHWQLQREVAIKQLSILVDSQFEVLWPESRRESHLLDDLRSVEGVTGITHRALRSLSQTNEEIEQWAEECALNKEDSLSLEHEYPMDVDQVEIGSSMENSQHWEKEPGLPTPPMPDNPQLTPESHSSAVMIDPVHLTVVRSETEESEVQIPELDPDESFE